MERFPRSIALRTDARTDARTDKGDIIEPVASLVQYDPKSVQNLSPDEVAALKSLLQDNSIVIQKSDKGNSVVVLDKTSYREKVQEILSDNTKFQRLNIKPGKDYNFIINQENRIKDALRQLNKQGVLDDKTFFQTLTMWLKTKCTLWSLEGAQDSSRQQT